MLILTRKIGQGFTIGDNVTITVTEISGDKVRIGIDAPREVKILRTELSETMEQNKQAASFGNVKTLRDKVKQIKLDGNLYINKQKLDEKEKDEQL